ncbi:uncharacterized protein LOC120132950 [Hibiscus syriacus]|uniref:uncharacterized protein LOC120132950 n=1 Tax=Hibiscus syriacus TaxID=106335 RepID=UPI0019247C8A|nr:uncharacterized protein LOC120132950 [Hibiscus syriacus]
MVRYTREIPPAHYSFKIEGFSLLSDTKVEKIESGIFEAGGYKEEGSLPNGNPKSNGKDFISLYLAIEETKSLPQRWEVNADEFKLFVFDQKENNYLTVQDSGDERIKRFQEMKTEWGFSKLISGNFERYKLSMIKNPDRSTLTWNLEKFSTLKETSYLSKPFTVGGRKWYGLSRSTASDLHEKSKGFVMNDTLIVEAKITLISVTKLSH